MDLLIDLMNRGGWVMYPIALCSIVGVGLCLERAWVLRRSRVLPQNFLLQINDLLRRKLYSEAAVISQNDNSSAARIISVGLKLLNQKRSFFKEGMEEAGRWEASELTRNLGALYLVASVSPLLGLLGTVSGMINAFDSIALQSVVNPALLAGGISEALLTTAAGLCVAIPALVAHRALASKADTLIMALESLSSDLMESMITNASPEPKPRTTAPA